MNSYSSWFAPENLACKVNIPSSAALEVSISSILNIIGKEFLFSSLE